MEDRMNKDKLMIVKNDLNDMEELLNGIKVEKADDTGRMDEKKVWTTHENMAVLKILQKKLSLVHNLLLHEEDTIYSSDYAFEPGKSTTLEEVELLKDQYERIFQQFNNIISNVNNNNNNNQSGDDNSSDNCDDDDDNIPGTTNIISCS
ncbi:hypothetical protein HELRODRAFT_191745, partial [Helobdella robusta]|uniref:Uncharacterized protein n=1 Tax=Helobdella robusta TaxID=6412 RepID=T1FT93_HELRO